jgi:hypothetical protein
MRRVVVAGVLAGLVATLAVGLGTGTAGAQSPITPANRPNGIIGQSNGRVADSELTVVEGSCRAARGAAASLARLFAAARADGVLLDQNDCYRPIETQAVVRAGSCAGGNCACAGLPGGSMHGWGKAVDFTDDGASITSFSQPGHRWLDANGPRFGWNFPAFAHPGQPCPEPWHWEWVGDGGNLGRDTVKADVAAVIASAGAYRTVTGLGLVTAHGPLADAGSVPSGPLGFLVVAAAPTPTGAGYWLLFGNGEVRPFGDAATLGSGVPDPDGRYVGIAATPSGHGYWLVTRGGDVQAFGDASFLGSTVNLRLNRPVVGVTASPTGAGYWLVSSDGGVFGFGDAGFFGSTGALRLNSGVVGVAAPPSGKGYWLVANDGGVFAFGAARFAGSRGGQALNTPMIGMASTPSGAGYWLVSADGGVFTFGDAPFHGAG